jgi:hypothetical protein
MRKAILVLGAVMAVLMFAMVGARAALAETVIDTAPQGNGTICCFGSGGDFETWGQLITAPADDTQLESFTFFISTNPIVMRGEVYAWDGEKATGPNLYESAPRTVTSTSGFEEVTFDTGGVQLVPGQQYVLFATVSKDYESSAATASWLGVFPGVYPGGYFVEMDNGSSFDQLFTNAWSLRLHDWDLAFKAVFSTSDSPTTKEDCKNGGYAKYGFKNQGQCKKAVNATPGSPAPLAPDRIVFSTTRFDGTYQLATMNPDGSDLQPISSTAGPPQEFAPAISPDRRSIAYVTDANELGVVNVDGTNSILLPPPPAGADRGFPDWSPNGQTIIYRQVYPDGSDSAVMRYPGEEVVIDLPGYDLIAAWGSNNRIVWANSQQGILSANPDGSDVVVLDSAVGFVNEPEVSPDGTKVVYFNNGDIWTMDANGSNKRNLTQDFNPLGGLPAWSPDGSQITFMAEQDIWVMNADGTNIHNVTNTPPGPLGVDAYPDWGVSPPG